MTGSREYKGVVVVIPTRNRASLAKNAIGSVISQDVPGVELLVSDNSTQPEELESLAKHCEHLRHPSLTYVRPPEPLPMSAHWDWAIEQALRSQKNHFIYLTDRMMFKRDELRPLVDLVSNYPQDIITYNHDRIIDDAEPIRIEQLPVSGKLLRLETLRLSYAYSQIDLHYCLPRMLNCVVPREPLENMRARFGNVFASIAPDFCFCCRSFEVVDSIIFYDQSPIFHYALKRSNGASLTRGELTQDHADFAASIDINHLTLDTPAPEIVTTGSIILHEYCRVRRETGSSRFFDLNREKYLAYLAQEVRRIEDKQRQANLYRALLKHGWKPSPNDIAETPVKRTVGWLVKKLLSPRAVRARIAWLIRDSAAKRIWILLARLSKISPPVDQRFEFEQTDEAIKYLNEFPTRESGKSTWVEEKLQPQVLPMISVNERPWTNQGTSVTSGSLVG
jgi:glycosyltransferase involved in cell wall biosynthesis